MKRILNSFVEITISKWQISLCKSNLTLQCGKSRWWCQWHPLYRWLYVGDFSKLSPTNFIYTILHQHVGHNIDVAILVVSRREIHIDIRLTDFGSPLYWKHTLKILSFGNIIWIWKQKLDIENTKWHLETFSVCSKHHFSLVTHIYWKHIKNKCIISLLI